MSWSCRLAALLVLLLPAATVAAGSFDGKYGGPRTVLRGSPPTCPAEGNTAWTVTDSRITLPFFATSVSADVGADGSFQTSFRYQVVARGMPGNGTLKGLISGGTLTADFETGACQMHYVLKKQ
jgi:hypothetical protein